MWSQTVIDGVVTILTNISSAWLIWIGYRYRTFSAEKRNAPVVDDKQLVFKSIVPDLQTTKPKKQGVVENLVDFWAWHRSK